MYIDMPSLEVLPPCLRHMQASLFSVVRSLCPSEVDPGFFMITV